jgi:hypothetical protein
MEEQRGVDARVGQARAELDQASVDGGPPGWRIYEWTNGRMDEFTNLRMDEWTNRRVCKSANVQISKSANRQISESVNAICQ